MPSFPLGARHAAPLLRPRLTVLALAAALPLSALAADPPATSTVTITGNPLGSRTLAQPSNVLTGEGLAVRRSGTLGETLDGLPGVSASAFGPQSSRPVIRGLDGDRIRLLDNGGASIDASNLSFDHAVAIDPLVVERLEVLRGPAALLYGGNATGGVVNALDNRIPRDALNGLGGRAELRLGGPAGDRAGVALLEGGANGLNWHADVARRLSSDLRTPRFSPNFAPIADGQAQPDTRTVANSAGRSEAGALGASWAGAQGFAGLAIDETRNDYGVAVEPDVTIRMRRSKLQAAGEWRGLTGWLSSLSAQASHTRYQHQEVEGSGAVGTTFSSRGQELRLQAQLTPVATLGGTLRGVVGVQAERLDFSALGEEAFVPGTLSHSQALFTVQELTWPGGLALQAGVRVERAQVHSDGDAPDATEPRFGAAAARRFSPRSASIGVVAPIGGAASGWRANATLGQTERAPAYYELYANGLHVATGVVEQGDAQQQLERSRHAEAGLQWQQGPHSLRATVWSTRFANFIALDADGSTRDVDGTAVPVYQFTGVPARLHGLEIDGRVRLASAPWQVDATAGIDSVRGRNQRTGEALPRLAPLRLQAGLEVAQGAWRGGVQVRHAARQTQVPATDVATPGHTLVDLWASWQQRLGQGSDLVWFAKLGNAGNALAYNASALRTARALSPAGARALQLGLRLAF